VLNQILKTFCFWLNRNSSEWTLLVHTYCSHDCKGAYEFIFFHIFMGWIQFSNHFDFENEWKFHSAISILLLLESYWKLFSCEWLYTNYWKWVASHIFDVQNSLLNALWLLAEWKFFIVESICMLHSATIFYSCYAVTLTLFSCECHFLHYQKRVVSHSFGFAKHLSFFLNVSS